MGWGEGETSKKKKKERRVVVTRGREEGAQGGRFDGLGRMRVPVGGGGGRALGRTLEKC